MNDLESAVKRTSGQGSLTLYLHISCDTFLCMSVHYNNKQHNGGFQLFCLGNSGHGSLTEFFSSQSRDLVLGLLLGSLSAAKGNPSS